MVCFSSVRTASAVMFLTLLWALALLLPGGTGFAMAESYEAVWSYPSTYSQGEQLAVELVVEPSHPAASPMTFVYLVRCEMGFENVNADFRVLDASGAIVHESMLSGHLQAGENKYQFEWPAAACAPGDYQAVLTIHYVTRRHPATCSTPLARVSSLAMAAEVSGFEQQLAAATERVDALAQSPDGLPYMRIRISLVRETLGAIRNRIADENWVEADRGLAYVRKALQTLNAGMVFANSAPELLPALPKMDGRVTPQGPSLFADGAPVALMGAVLDMAKDDPPGRLARMAALGMNFAVVQLNSVEAVNASPFDSGVIGSVLHPVLDAAAEKGVAVVLQLSQDALGHAIQAQVPDLQAPGFVTLSHPALRAALERHVKAVGDAVAGRESVMGLSLAESPAFKFDGEPVRQAFIGRVREVYPDRQDLNRIWRSQLANYDEITIWGDYPRHAYQNQRAYQFDWQSFHTRLVDEALSSLRAAAGPACPGLSIMITMPETAFEKGETKYAPDRELAALLMDINGCTVSAGASARLPYAVDFPRAAIHYALQRSYLPQKPVLNLSAGISATEGLDQRRCYDTVRTLLWEALISGASGLAVPPDSPVYARPAAMEALSVTALDARRLAGIIRAFAEAPADVLVFFSESSKIMDNGDPHLQSAYHAFEGCSFSGYQVRFVTEREIANGALDPSKVLVMPETPAATDAAFRKIDEFVENGGAVARVGTPIPYNERGKSRADVIRTTGNTVFVEGMNMPTEYLHTMDTSIVRKTLPPITRPVNVHGYPLEGVHTRFVVVDGEAYLYVVNLRPDPVSCQLEGGMHSGRDLIQGRDVTFPRDLAPLEPMLLRLQSSTQVAVAP